MPYEEIFGVESLSGAIRTFDEQEHDHRIWDLFSRSAKPLRPDGRIVRWDELRHARHLAPVKGEDSPHPLVQQTTRIHRSEPLIWLKQSKTIPAGRLFRDRAAGSLAEDAREVVADELADLRILINKTREFICSQTLLGVLSVQPANVPDSDLVFRINYAVTLRNAAADWANAGTSIIGELNLSQQAYIAASGESAALAITNDVVYGSLMTNTEIQTLARYVQAPGGDNLLATNISSPRFFESLRIGQLEWVVSEGGYVPQGGAFTRFFQASDPGQARDTAQDRVVLLPGRERLREVLGLALGRGDVAVGDLAPGEGQLGALRRAPQPGWYAYTEVVANPPGLRLHAGFVFLPVVLFPPGVMEINTTP